MYTRCGKMDPLSDLLSNAIQNIYSSICKWRYSFMRYLHYQKQIVKHFVSNISIVLHGLCFSNRSKSFYQWWLEAHMLWQKCRAKYVSEGSHICLPTCHVRSLSEAHTIINVWHVTFKNSKLRSNGISLMQSFRNWMAPKGTSLFYMFDSKDT